MRNQANRLNFPMRTVFQDLFLVTFAVSPASLNALLPDSIRAFERNGEAYISIVVGNLRGMRLGFVPEFLGTNYYQIVYRAVVQIEERGVPRIGVFFLRSDCNDPMMSFFGNRFTEFRFHYFHSGSISLMRRDDRSLISIESSDGGGDLIGALVHRGAAESHPPAKGFSSVAEEKEVLVELFHAFAQDDAKGVVYDLEIERERWNLYRVDCTELFSAFFHEGPFTPATARLASALHIRECSYVWKPMTAIPLADLARAAG